MTQINKISDYLQSIIGQAGNLAMMGSSIAKAMREQTSALQIIASRIERTNAYSKESANATSINAAASNQLFTKANQLNCLVSTFKLVRRVEGGLGS